MVGQQFSSTYNMQLLSSLHSILFDIRSSNTQTRDILLQLNTQFNRGVNDLLLGLRNIIEFFHRDTRIFYHRSAKFFTSTEKSMFYFTHYIHRIYGVLNDIADAVKSDDEEWTIFGGLSKDIENISDSLQKSGKKITQIFSGFFDILLKVKVPPGAHLMPKAFRYATRASQATHGNLASLLSSIFGLVRFHLENIEDMLDTLLARMTGKGFGLERLLSGRTDIVAIKNMQLSSIGDMLSFIKGLVSGDISLYDFLSMLTQSSNEAIRNFFISRFGFQATAQMGKQTYLMGEDIVSKAQQEQSDFISGLLRQNAGNIINALLSIAPNIIKSVSGSAQKEGQDLIQGLEQLFPKLQQLLSGIDIFKIFFKKIDKLLSDAQQLIKDSQSLVHKVKQIQVKDISNAVENIIQNIFNNANNQNAIKAWIKESSSELLLVLRGGVAKNLTKGVLDTLFREIKTKSLLLLRPLAMKFALISGAIGGVFFLGYALWKNRDRIIEWIKNIPGRILSFIEKSWDMIMNTLPGLIEEGFHYLSDTFGSIFSKLWKVFQEDILGRIKDVGEAIWNVIKEQGANIYKYLKSVVNSLIEEIKIWIADIKQWVKNAFSLNWWPWGSGKTSGNRESKDSKRSSSIQQQTSNNTQLSQKQVNSENIGETIGLRMNQAFNIKDENARLEAEYGRLYLLRSEELKANTLAKTQATGKGHVIPVLNNRVQQNNMPIINNTNVFYNPFNDGYMGNTAGDSMILNSLLNP